jgi:site-specific DNA-methyltransferase (adenine-specific)
LPQVIVAQQQPARVVGGSPTTTAAARRRGRTRQGACATNCRYDALMAGRIYNSDNLEVLQGLEDASVDLVYIDPPFNTGRAQTRRSIKTVRDADGDRTGFKGERYKTTLEAERAYDDAFEDYLAFLQPRLQHAHRVLKPSGSIYFHVDYREAHYCKVFLLDPIFGRDNFVNEIIWAYDYGGRGKRRWPAKHDTIFLYAKDAALATFNQDAIERIPYMAPGLVGPEKAARGKLPTDVWWHTIVGTASNEKTGYPTQKPLGVVRRALQASSNPGELVLDFFAGSGTTGAACIEEGRDFILVDNNPQAIEVMRKRFKSVKGIKWQK